MQKHRHTYTQTYPNNFNDQTEIYLDKKLWEIHIPRDVSGSILSSHFINLYLQLYLSVWLDRKMESRAECKVIQSAPSEFLVTFKTLKLYNLKKIVKLGGGSVKPSLYSVEIYIHFILRTLSLFVLVNLWFWRHFPHIRSSLLLDPQPSGVPFRGGSVSLDRCLDLSIHKTTFVLVWISIALWE